MHIYSSQITIRLCPFFFYLGKSRRALALRVLLFSCLLSCHFSFHTVTEVMEPTTKHVVTMLAHFVYLEKLHRPLDMRAILNVISFMYCVHVYCLPAKSGICEQ